MPLVKNRIVATRDGHCRVDRPAIPCPLVHPPEYRVPKPTKNPPPATINKCCQVIKCDQLNISTGKIPICCDMPNSFRLSIVSGERGIGVTGCNNIPPMNPPSKRPTAKRIFHNLSFQLYLRNGMFAGKHIAHTCRNVLDIPSILLPKSRSAGTVRPIIGPAMYQGHGRRKRSIISIGIIFQAAIYIRQLRKNLLKKKKRIQFVQKGLSSLINTLTVCG